ncbi:MAG: 50S ribosomal protein L11 methyltransferase, partial [Pseudomonadota bacterium]
AVGLNHTDWHRNVRYDLIMANILQKPLLRLIPGLANRLEDRGILVLSGLVSCQIKLIRARARSHGLVVVKSIRWGQSSDYHWCSLILLRLGKKKQSGAGTI